MADQQTNLKKLKKELSTKCTSGSDETSKTSATVLAGKLPLAHSTPNLEVLQAVLTSGQLLSPSRLLEERKKTEATTEKRLGTEGMTFTYCGTARRHGKGCALLFASKVEEPEALRGKKSEATPFDSGGIVKVYMRGKNMEEQRKFLKEHTLPVPGYRDLLGTFMAFYFNGPEDYVSGKKPKEDPPWTEDFSPGALAQSDARAWSFEVRFEDALSTGKYVEAVIVELAATAYPKLAKLLAELEETNNIKVILYDPTQSADETEEEPHDLLARAVAKYIQKYISEAWPQTHKHVG